MRNDFRPLDEETIEKAVLSLRNQAAHEQHAVKILSALKHSGLVGRVFNASCLPLAQKALDEYSVRYSINEYAKPRWRCLYVSWPNISNVSLESWELRLATKEAPRLTEETIDEAMNKAREMAKKYMLHAGLLASNAPIYNNACSYLRPIWQSIETAMNYADVRYW